MHSVAEFQVYLYGLATWKLFLMILFGFGIVYFGLAAFFTLLTQIVFPRFGIGNRIESRPLKKGQVFNELKRSFLAIIVFALYGVVILNCDRLGWFHIVWQYSWAKVMLDLLILFLWNEVHFYFCHRLLHQRWLYKQVHVHHHLSVTPTPFSTFSLHWLEAMLLSSVMVICLLFYNVSIIVVIGFPLLSLILNNIGHMNYEIYIYKNINLFSSCKRHTAHHTKCTVNFGFFLPWLDKLFQTNYPKE